MADHSAPAIAGIHHISFTVRDIDASISWYERVFHAQRLPMTFPHYGCEDTGYAVLLIEPRSGLAIGLHKNTGNGGDLFDEAQTGLDHIGSGCRPARNWTRGPVGLTHWTSRTPVSGPAMSRSRSPPSCSGTPTTSSWSSSQRRPERNHGQRSVRRVISLGAKTRKGGPQNPVPRLVYSAVRSP